MRRFLALPLLLVLAACATTTQPAKLPAIDSAVETAIANGKLPGGVIWIEGRDDIYRKAYGNRAVVPAVEEMTVDTIFDAASITKVVATAPSLWLLIDRGLVELDAPAKRYLPELADGSITVRHLMTHTSGLPPSLDLSDEWSGYGEGVRRAAATPGTNRPGATFRYSDINYILVGEIVRRVSGEPLDEFARKNVFEPLGMRDTRYLPIASGAPRELARIAPTEEGLRGVVHDPTARRMGGVAGHAGVFTTAADLARFARTLLRGGYFPAEMTKVASPRGVAVRRAAGFDFDSNYSRPRGDFFSNDSFGHTGWTGGFFWIDPRAGAFYVFLSNRNHPNGKGSVTQLQHQLGNLVAQSLPDGPRTAVARRVGYILGGADAMNGIDVLHAAGYEALQGKRIGLITNRSAIDRFGNPTVDLLRSAKGVELAAIFSPEHGLRGTADEKIADEVDPISGLPVLSLYGESRKPSLEQLRGLDALVFDIQDVGTRFYTYISTMGLAMEAAAEAKVRFVVLDRVNPIGGSVVEGPVLEGESDFVGWHPLPVRHGMTVGELARMFRAEREIDVDLDIIPVRGWSRPQWQDEAGLPWINTSPNMRSLAAAALYPGIGLLERSLSVGRGTATPFEVLGAPWLDGAQLIRELGEVPGLAFEPIRFTPDASIHAGEECGGVRMRIVDRQKFRPVDAGIRIAIALQHLYPRTFPLDEMAPLLRHPATLEAIRGGKSLAEIRASWGEQAFEARRAPFLLYPTAVQ